MSGNGIWGTTFEMTLFYLIYGVNLISISNFTSKFLVFDAKLTCNLMQVDCPQEIGKIFVYHHLHGYPLTPSSTNNHFCHLKKKKKTVPTNIFPFIREFQDRPTSAIIDVKDEYLNDRKPIRSKNTRNLKQTKLKVKKFENLANKQVKRSPSD